MTLIQQQEGSEEEIAENTEQLMFSCYARQLMHGFSAWFSFICSPFLMKEKLKTTIPLKFKLNEMNRTTFVLPQPVSPVISLHTICISIAA